jgi:hypothetical protein
MVSSSALGGGSGGTWNDRLSLSGVGPGLIEIARYERQGAPILVTVRRPGRDSRDDMIGKGF